MLINYLKSLVWTSAIILIGTIFITIFNYFNILTGTPMQIVEILIPIIAIFIGGYMIGKASSKKGYIEGLKYSAIWVIIFLIINLIAKDVKLGDFIYFLLLILSSVLSSMIGINRKKV
ncbi:MAG: TIGR04086 family membrane protein [Bacilli bacterium]